MRIVSFLNFKGGSGKSSILQNLAGILSKKYGKKVLVIDCDPQSNTSVTFKANPDYPSLNDVLLGNVEINESIQPMDYGFLISSDADLYSANILLNDDDRSWKLADALDALKGDFDYVLIDNPPGLSVLTMNSLLASDSIIVPIAADPYSLQGMSNLSETIENIAQQTGSDLKIEGVLLNKFDRRPKIARDIRELAHQIAENLDTKLFDAVIRNSVKVTEAQLNQKALIDHAPKSPVYSDYENFAEEFLNDEKNR